MSHAYMVFLFIHHGFSARVALMIARKATPTSANTAAHIFAKPRAPSTITMIAIGRVLIGLMAVLLIWANFQPFVQATVDVVEVILESS